MLPEPAPVQLGRVYDQSTAGARVLVDRLWPRGLTKQAARLDDWCRDVAPSTELRRWYGHDPALLQEFSRRYRDELQAPERARALDSLWTWRHAGGLVLLTATKDLDLSHAALLADLLNGRSGSAGTG